MFSNIPIFSLTLPWVHLASSFQQTSECFWRAGGVWRGAALFERSNPSETCIPRVQEHESSPVASQPATRIVPERNGIWIPQDFYGVDLYTDLKHLCLSFWPPSPFFWKVSMVTASANKHTHTHGMFGTKARAWNSAGLMTNLWQHVNVCKDDFDWRGRSHWLANTRKTLFRHRLKRNKLTTKTERAVERADNERLMESWDSELL